MDFYPQHIQVTKDLRSLIVDQDIPATLLLAEMQSGKTLGFLHFGLTMYTEKHFDKVYIISGTADTTLRDQLKSDLDKAIMAFAENDLSKFFSMKENIHVRYGTQIKALGEELIGMERTLIIHDESHYAQTKTNIPYQKLYKKIGIEKALSGDFTSLREKGCALLDVSATPFSELISNQIVGGKEVIDAPHLEEKGIVFMPPGEGYIGIRQLLQSGRIHFTSKRILEKDHEHLRSVIKKTKYLGKYCLVRSKRAEKDRDFLERLALKMNCNYLPIFGGCDSDVFDILKNKPEKTTIVHLCNKARMGQVLPKEHIGMVYEQSQKPNIDTLLQGLLGRMCGYYTNFDIDIYLTEKRKLEIEKYVKAINEKEDISLQKELLSDIAPAMNVVNSVRKSSNEGEYFQAHPDSKRFPNTWNRKIAPIRITLEDLNAVVDQQREKIGLYDKLADYDIFQDIMILLESDNFLKYHEDKNEILEQLNGIERKNDLFSRKRWKLLKTRSIQQLNQASLDGQRFVPSELFPAKKDGMIITNAGFGISCSEKEAFIYGFIRCSKPVMELAKLRLTVKKQCNYVNQLENEDEIVANGAQPITFPQETSKNPNLFEMKLEEAINRTKPDHVKYIEECLSALYSNYCNIGKEYKGIILLKESYDETIIHDIKKRIEIKCNVLLDFVKSRGRQPADAIRYVSIKWQPLITN